MAIAATIDTLAYAKRLIEAGVPQKQAEVQAELLAEVIEEKLTTKPELFLEAQSIREINEKLDTKMDHRFSELEGKMEHRFIEMDHRFNELDNKIDLKSAESKAEMIKWVIGISAAQAALIVSLLRFLH